MRKEKLLIEIEDMMKADFSKGIKIMMSPFGDFRTPFDIILEEAKLKGIYFDLFKDGDEEKYELGEALEGFDRLQEYIGGENALKSLGTKKPNFEFNIAREKEESSKDINGGFMNSKSLEILLFRDLGLVQEVSGNVSHVIDNKLQSSIFHNGREIMQVYTIPFSSFKYKLPSSSFVLHRRYGCRKKEFEKYFVREKEIEKIDFLKVEVISRSPIIFNADIAKRLKPIFRFAGLGYQALINQLEPLTTEILNKKLKEYEGNLNVDVLHNKSEECQNQEVTVANSIVKEWLYTINNKGFSREDKVSWKGQVVCFKDEQKALQSVSLNGPHETLRFYKNPEWDYNKFLSGRF